MTTIVFSMMVLFLFHRHIRLIRKSVNHLLVQHPSSAALRLISRQLVLMIRLNSMNAIAIFLNQRFRQSYHGHKRMECEQGNYQFKIINNVTMKSLFSFMLIQVL